MATTSKSKAKAKAQAKKDTAKNAANQKQLEKNNAKAKAKEQAKKDTAKNKANQKKVAQNSKTAKKTVASTIKNTSGATSAIAATGLAATDNLTTTQIQKWVEDLKSNLTKFKNNADLTEDILQKMASTVKSTNSPEIHQALSDLRALAETTHRQLGNFGNTLSSQLNKYLKEIGASSEGLTDKLKKQDQFRENANKISKLSMSNKSSTTNKSATNNSTKSDKWYWY